MKISSPAIIAILLQCAISPVWAADDTNIARLATCQDSWLDWEKSDPARMKKLGEYFAANFLHKDSDAFAVPKSNISVAGLRITKAFPDSIGMGVGFSVTVAAPFDVARKTAEKLLGKPLGKCEASDGMTSCELEIADKRTVTLMAEDDTKATSTLIGCYYDYEK